MTKSSIAHMIATLTLATAAVAGIATAVPTDAELVPVDETVTRSATFGCLFLAGFRGLPDDGSDTTIYATRQAISGCETSTADGLVPVEDGTVSEAAWACLFDAGYRGRQGDGMEAIYAPAEAVVGCMFGDTAAGA